MGLDNGIIRIEKTIIPENLEPEQINELKNEEICYWRKSWDIRDAVIHDVFNDKDEQFYFYEIDKTNIKKIIKVITAAGIGIGDTERLNAIKEDLLSPNPKYCYFFYDSY